jgi:alkyl sulfatase BDS1-like metallo-beta-lactamase superfamily hydrolase
MASPTTPNIHNIEELVPEEPGDADTWKLCDPDPGVVTGEGGKTVWDNNAAYNEFINGPPPATANGNLWKQSQQLVKQGLYKVADDIHQLRGFDLSNMTIVRGKTGLIVIDPLVSKECAKAALDLYNKHFYLDQKPPLMPPPATAIIYTHSHIDHYGGAAGVLPPTDKVEDFQIIAPSGFLEHAVSENIYAGNAMNRRANYMYGDRIPKGPEYNIGTGLGMNFSSGSLSIVKPTKYIDTNCDLVVDGVEISFQLTPGTEAPAEMNFYFPKSRALCMAENATHTMHNIQTLRGALVRDAHMWSKYLDEAIELFVDKTDVVFASHHWPTWGTKYVREFMTSQRDMYAYLNDQTLRMLNEGQTGLEIAEKFKLPESLSSKPYNHGFYGSVSHNVKAIYHRYMGWFDGNPAHLWEWPPVEAGKLYLECMGGVQGVRSLAQGYKEKGNLRFAATLLSHAVFGTDPSDDHARVELAAVLKELGYGAECGPWRNFFIVGAYELMEGIQAPVLGTINFESMMALDLSQLMDTMAIRLDGPSIPPGQGPFTIEFVVTSEAGVIEDRISLTLSNCALTNRRPRAIHAASATSSDGVATLSCKLTHSELVHLVMGGISIRDINTSGDASLWNTLTSYLAMPEPDFAIVTPEKIRPPRKG